MLSPESLEEITKVQSYQTAAWEKVQRIGRNYAMMEAQGCYMENGTRVSLSHSDRKDYTDLFVRNLLTAVRDAYFEDAQVGIAIADAKETQK